MVSSKKAFVVAFIAASMFAGAAFAEGISLRGVVDPAFMYEDQNSAVSIRFQEPDEGAQKSKVDLSGWGGFGGVIIQYVNIDLSPTDPMTDDRGTDSFDNEMLLIGGLGGLIYKDFRMGGFGFGNSQDTADKVAGERHSAKMSYGGGGIFMELNHTFTPNFGLALGSYFGAGNMSFEASGDDLDPLGVDGKWDADGTFFMAYPYGGLWFAPVKWMWVQVDAGYLYFNMDTSGSEWENDLDVEMVDDDLTGGFSASFKVNFGWNPNIK